MQSSIFGATETFRKFWCGPLSDLMVKLGGEQGPEYRRELGKFVTKRACWEKRMKKRSLVPLKFVWINDTPPAKLIRKTPFGQNELWLLELAKKVEAISLKEDERIVDLAFLSLRDLGFTDEVVYGDFLSQEFLNGWSEENLDCQRLVLCQMTDAFQMAYQHLGQLPLCSTIRIASEPAHLGSKGPELIFLSSNAYGKESLLTCEAGPEKRCDLNWVHVFRIESVVKP